MTVTHWAIIIFSVALIGYGVWAAATKKQPTISSTLTEWAFRNPIVPFGIGVLMGHFFW